jgi:hypothetical protein
MAVLAVAGLVQAANTGSLTGIVRDAEGEALPGVTVQISAEVLIGGPQVAVSGPDGGFAFRLLPVGSYTVVVSMPGFREFSAEVPVRSGQVASVSFRMVPDRFSGEIEVSAEVPVVNTSQVNTGEVWDAEYMKHASVGMANRHYQHFLSQAAGVAANVDPDNGNPSVFGSVYSENSYLLDNMNTTDPRFGTWTTIVNMDAIQELSLRTGGSEAEFGLATGGIVNLITKSGGNDFSGSLDARYQADSFTESGEHYDPAELENSLQWYSATLGGPLLRDRLWFFSSLQYIEDSTQQVDTHFPSVFTGWHALGKLTWQAAASHRLVLRYSADPADIPGRNSNPFVLESASYTHEQGGDFWQLELSSVLSDAWLLVAQAATSSAFVNNVPSNYPDTVSGHENEDTGLSYHNYGLSYFGPRPRDELRANATWFVDGLAGSHELKGGTGLQRTRYDYSLYYNGGGFVTDHVPRAVGDWQPVDLNRDGYFNHSVRIQEQEESVRERSRNAGRVATFFLQDAWRPHPDLTIKPGIRLDNVTHENDRGEQVADMSRWQPRLGLAWDLRGDGRHVLRASAGRFMEATSVYLATGDETFGSRGDFDTLEYLCNRTAGTLCDVESLPPSYGDPIYWTNWDGQQYVLVGGPSIYRPGTRVTLDQTGLGRLRAPYSDQLILAYELQPAAQVSLGLSYVNKKTENLINDTCSNNEWVWGAAPPPDIDDPSTWTTNAGCTASPMVLANIPGLERSYEAWILRLESRRRWGHLLASYTYSDSRANSAAGPHDYAYFEADYFPMHFHNRMGRHDRPQQLKLNGYFLLPARFTIGVDGFWAAPAYDSVLSTCPRYLDAPDHRSTTDQLARIGADPAWADYCWTPDGHTFSDDHGIFLRPRGSHTSSSLWQMDVQLSKAFRVGRTDLSAILTVYNLFGTELATSFNQSALVQQTDDDGNPLFYQDDDPSAPYYDPYYGADDSPVLIPIGAPISYQHPRSYEIGLRFEF